MLAVDGGYRCKRTRPSTRSADWPSSNDSWLDRARPARLDRDYASLFGDRLALALGRDDLRDRDSRRWIREFDLAVPVGINVDHVAHQSRGARSVSRSGRFGESLASIRQTCVRRTRSKRSTIAGLLTLSCVETRPLDVRLRRRHELRRGSVDRDAVFGEPRAIDV